MNLFLHPKGVHVLKKIEMNKKFFFVIDVYHPLRCVCSSQKQIGLLRGVVEHRIGDIFADFPRKIENAGIAQTVVQDLDST